MGEVCVCFSEGVCWGRCVCVSLRVCAGGGVCVFL